MENTNSRIIQYDWILKRKLILAQAIKHVKHKIKSMAPQIPQEKSIWIL